MSWLKLGRWLLVGIVGVNGAAACGGRGSLPTGAGETGDEFGGTVATAGVTTGGSAIAGTTSVGGATSTGATSSFGGTLVGGTGSIGGSASIGGTLSMAGAAGMGGVCVPGQGFCSNKVLAICNPTGTGFLVKRCVTGQICVQAGDVAACKAQICTPGQTQCDQSGGLVQVCSADGLSLVTKLDCSAQGQRCRDGVCRSLVCQPNQRFCDKTGVRLCNADGSASTAWENCGVNQYCDPMALTCKQGICAPGEPACNGTVATTCNANGSGYTGVGVDCAKQLDRQCVLGACLCAPNEADCDGIAKNGCEISVATDPDNCTGCDLVCSSNHMASRSCDNGCDGACQAGFQDCNGDKLSDGCEVDPGSDPKNCGGCDMVCSNNHANPRCAGGTCNGACSKNFQDCNGDKLSDGCESDSRSDVENCGGCAVACSTNHVKPLCSASTCGGGCEGGFADCNGNKQTDGCEINTLTDAKNCGSCGKPCPAGQSCGGGKCTSLFSFSGIAQNLPIASLAGWSQCFFEPYGQTGTSISSIQQACTGSQLLMACRAKGSDTLQLAANAPRADVLFDVGIGNVTHSANGVAWYFNGAQSWGFAPDGDIVSRTSCDTQDSALGTGVDGDQRLCWHTGNSALQGGWRCGRNDSLNASFDFERLVFQAP
jgi:hypothetical protein